MSYLSNEQINAAATLDDDAWLSTIAVPIIDGAATKFFSGEDYNNLADMKQFALISLHRERPRLTTKNPFAYLTNLARWRMSDRLTQINKHNLQQLHIKKDWRDLEKRVGNTSTKHRRFYK